MSRAGMLLDHLCEVSVVYVLAFHLIGLFNLVFGVPRFTPVTVLLTAALAITGWALYRKPRLQWTLPSVSPFRIPMILLGATYLLFLADNLTAFPNGYDAISYHLQKPLSWVQSGTIRLTETTWKMALPANGELFELPALALKIPRLAFVGNLLGTLILAMSVYILGARVSGFRQGGILSVLVVLSIPMVLFQTFYIDMDVLGVAFLFAAVALFIRFADTDRLPTAVLSALVLGLSMGTKHVYIAYGALAMFFAIVILLTRRQAVLIPLLVLASALPSTLWISRNWMATGNPAYPFAVRIGRISLRGANFFPPFVIKATATGPGSSRFKRGNPFNEDRGLGPTFAVFGVAAVLAAILDGFRTRRPELITAVATLVILCLFWWSSLHVFRFGLPLFVTVGVFCAIFYSILSPRYRLAAQWLLTLSLACGCVLCLEVPFRRLFARIQLHDWSRATYYAYPPLLDTLPAGVRILDRSKDSRMGFALSGARLQNRVVHLDGAFTSYNLSRVQFNYVVKEGKVDAEDAYFARRGDLVFEGVPTGLLAAAETRWRVYQINPDLPIAQKK